LRFAFSAQCKSAFGFCPEPPPSGYAVVRHPTLGEAQGHVCGYSASDISNEASFVIEVEKGSGTLGSFPFVLFDAGDFQGEPPTGTFPPDQLAVAEATGCRSAGLLVFVGFVDQGNIVVKNR
jgi:hypothetical protein